MRSEGSGTRARPALLGSPWASLSCLPFARQRPSEPAPHAAGTSHVQAAHVPGIPDVTLPCRRTPSLMHEHKPAPPLPSLCRKVAQEIDVKDLPKDLGKVAVTLLEDPTDKAAPAPLVSESCAPVGRCWVLGCRCQGCKGATLWRQARPAHASAPVRQAGVLLCITFAAAPDSHCFLPSRRRLRRCPLPPKRSPPLSPRPCLWCPLRAASPLAPLPRLPARPELVRTAAEVAVRPAAWCLPMAGRMSPGRYASTGVYASQHI